MAMISAKLHRTQHNITLNNFTGLALVPAMHGTEQEVGALFLGKDQFGQPHEVAISRNNLLGLAQSGQTSGATEEARKALESIAHKYVQNGKTPRVGDTHNGLQVQPLNHQHVLYTHPTPRHISAAQKLWAVVREEVQALFAPAKPGGNSSTPDISPRFN